MPPLCLLSVLFRHIFSLYFDLPLVFQQPRYVEPTFTLTSRWSWPSPSREVLLPFKRCHPWASWIWIDAATVSSWPRKRGNFWAIRWPTGLLIQIENGSCHSKQPRTDRWSVIDHNVRRKVTSLFQFRSWCLLCILIIVSLSLVYPSGAKTEFDSTKFDFLLMIQLRNRPLRPLILRTFRSQDINIMSFNLFFVFSFETLHQMQLTSSQHVQKITPLTVI